MVSYHFFGEAVKIAQKIGFQIDWGLKVVIDAAIQLGYYGAVLDFTDNITDLRWRSGLIQVISYKLLDNGCPEQKISLKVKLYIN